MGTLCTYHLSFKLKTTLKIKSLNIKNITNDPQLFLFEQVQSLHPCSLGKSPGMCTCSIKLQGHAKNFHCNQPQNNKV